MICEAVGEKVHYRPLTWEQFRSLPFWSAVTAANAFQYFAGTGKDPSRWRGDRPGGWAMSRRSRQADFFSGSFRLATRMWAASKKSRYSCSIAGVATSINTRFSSQNSMT